MPEIKKKVSDPAEGLNQAIKISDMLEEVDFCYDTGIAGPYFQAIKKHLDEAIGFYQRHQKPNSPQKGAAIRNLKLANKTSVGLLLKGINTLLKMSGHTRQITLPTNLATLERSCDILFHYSVQENEQKTRGSTEDGTKDLSVVPEPASAAPAGIGSSSD
jgi:hypothetical protein